MPDDPTKPNPPDSPAPASTPTPPKGNEKTTDAGAPPTTLRSPWFREALPSEYGKSFVIGAQSPKQRR
jgi:hypothetical protein